MFLPKTVEGPPFLVKEHPRLVVMIAEGCISLTAAAQLEVQAGSKEAAVSLFISNSSINTSAFQTNKGDKGSIKENAKQDT